MTGGGAIRTLVLVDGSNVARCAAWVRALDEVARADLALARRRLVDAVASWAGGEGVDVLVTFDGAGPFRPGRTRIGPGVEVEGTGASRTGDDVLERLAAEARTDARVHWVVTSDRELAAVAGAGAERTIDADTFVTTRLRAAVAGSAGARGETHAASDPAARGAAGASGLGALLDPEVAARLERLRRGDA